MGLNANNFFPIMNNNKLHIGLIPDGCRRWSKSNSIPIDESYQLSSIHIFKFIRYFMEKYASIISIYGASSHNFKRDKENVRAFCLSYDNLLRNYLIDYCLLNNISLIIVGDCRLFPDFLHRTVNIISQKFSLCGEKKIYFLLGYNPIEELKHSISEDPTNFLNNLSVSSPLNIVIRTGGANLLSDFLPLQCSYARLYFLEKYFLDTQFSEFEEIITSYISLVKHYGE